MRTFLKLTAVIFGIIALLHGLRLVYGWEAVIGGVEIPLWASAAAFLAAAVLGWGLWRESR
ncbi:MAG: hypothetical protein HZB99_02415 [Candidatus Harrisonbacteria bacterium]|nr:hypothetical protein [Candidatus Harrisonbacteria bacterium]